MKNTLRLLIFILLASLFLLPACADNDGPADNNLEGLVEEFGLEPLPDIPYPPDNQYNADRVELGRLLFYDPIVSGEKRSTCGTCHHPAFGFADGRKLSIGVSDSPDIGPMRTHGTSILSFRPIDDVPRNAPTIFNTAFNLDSLGIANHKGVMFWDGRARGLEEQAVLPPTSRDEMRGDAWDPDKAMFYIVNSRLNREPEYVEWFKKAFPAEAKKHEDNGTQFRITEDMYAKSLAAFQRELVTRNSPYDRFLAGQTDALTDQQKKGARLFFTKGKCGSCHTGPMLSDYKFSVVGVPQIGPGKRIEKGEDYGREEFTLQAAHRYKFRTPTIRNVSITGPYMHSGVFETLKEVVEFYNRGSKPRHPRITDDMLHPDVREPLGLTEDEIDAIVSFMESLEDNGSMLDPRLLEVPETVPSGLTPLAGAKAPR